MERRLPQFFFALSMIVLALMLGAIWQAGTPAWRTYQQEFRRLEAAGEPNAAAKSGVLDAALVIRQELGTDKLNAHGRVPFWQEPLLPKEYIRASCGRCHKEGEVPGVPELTDGRRLFETQGCRGCHKLNGVGGTVGPDLTEEGAVHRAPAWLERHFLDPNAVSRNSPMPNFHFTKEQARALTFYMLSLTSEQMATYYSSVRLIPSAGYGRQLFTEKNC